MNMADIASKPVFFEKNRVFRVYTGGKLFSQFFGDDSTDGFYPEEWICSSTKALNENSTDPYEGISIIQGTDIRFDQLIEEEKDLMLGDRIGLDVLVKALDSAIRLPVQAHPDKAFSRQHFNSSFGKAESWLVLGAREGACIYFGFKDGVTPEEFQKAVFQLGQRNGDFTKAQLDQFSCCRHRRYHSDIAVCLAGTLGVFIRREQRCYISHYLRRTRSNRCHYSQRFVRGEQICCK